MYLYQLQSKAAFSREYKLRRLSAVRSSLHTGDLVLSTEIHVWAIALSSPCLTGDAVALDQEPFPFFSILFSCQDTS